MTDPTPETHKPHQIYAMAPHTAWGWTTIAFKTVDLLNEAGLLAENADKGKIAAIINNTYVDFSDNSQANIQTDSVWHTAKPRSGSG